MNIDLRHGETLAEMQKMVDEGIVVDMILADLPYGTTSNKWDAVIPFEPMWELYWKLLKPTGVIVLTASQPFSSALIMSQPKYFKHEWIWLKNRGSNFANTVREPMKEHEQVLVFSKGKWTYNKQMQERTGAGLDRVKYNVKFESKSENYRQFEGRTENKLSDLRVPSSWQKFNTDTSGLHPTIKPIPLFEYMIKTYTNEGETILDNTMGSGTTAIACMNLNRNFIGIELEEKYFEIAKKRVEEKRKEKGLQAGTLFGNKIKNIMKGKLEKIRNKNGDGGWFINNIPLHTDDIDKFVNYQNGVLIHKYENKEVEYYTEEFNHHFYGKFDVVRLVV